MAKTRDHKKKMKKRHWTLQGLVLELKLISQVDQDLRIHCPKECLLMWLCRKFWRKIKAEEMKETQIGLHLKMIVSSLRTTKWRKRHPTLVQADDYDDVDEAIPRIRKPGRSNPNKSREEGNSESEEELKEWEESSITNHCKSKVPCLNVLRERYEDKKLTMPLMSVMRMTMLMIITSTGKSRN